MSDLTEKEILDRHRQALKEAKEACRLLGLNADPEVLFPRGQNYKNLKIALELLEGSARQMAQWRGNYKWVRLGIHYAKALKVVQRMFQQLNWKGFTDLMPMFDNGERAMNELMNRAHKQAGPILPTSPSNWLIIPDDKPMRRAMN